MLQDLSPPLKAHGPGIKGEHTGGCGDRTAGVSLRIWPGGLSSSTLFLPHTGQQGKGFRPSCARVEKGDAREKPCIPGAILVVAAGSK